MLRSCGLMWDIRKEFPYEIYSSLEFDVPVGLNGDCYDRYLIRLEEMRQSLRILIQCLNNMSVGDVIVSNFKYGYVSKYLSKKGMESIIDHFSYYSKNIVLPKGEVFISVEAPKGEFGVYLVSCGSNNLYRCKIKAPGLSHLQSLDFMSKELFLADVVTIIGTQDIVFGEIDR